MDTGSTTAQGADPDATQAVDTPVLNAGPDTPRTNEVIGRYVVLEQIGKGGMGVVYAAYDPELDRRIAVKLVRTRDHHEEALRDQARLLREAQALARLSHPNVVAVHDAGTAGSEVFVAMDFAEGMTLNKWLSATGRRWRETLGVMISAGNGLAAAHAAGLVHRDFKPANIIVGEDGRVRVLDFGLALAEHQVDPDTGTFISGASNMLDSRMTQTGTVMGTPAYMAPEQFTGTPADARSDQFSFCVVLYEALYDKRPFPGDKVEEIRKAMESGEIPPGDATRSVPPWLHRAILVGLRIDPTQRHDTMDQLLATISQDPFGRWRKLGVGVGVAALAVVAIYGYARPPESAGNPCVAAQTGLDGVWDVAHADQLVGVFDGHGEAWASTAGHKTREVLDAYAQRWETGRRDACEATHVRGEQSAKMLDLRMQCLDHQRRDLGALVDRLIDADEELIARSVQAAHELAPIDRCADVELLTAKVPLPQSDADRQEVERLRMELASARTDLRAARFDAGLATVSAASSDINQLGHRPLEAEMHLLRGRLYARNGDLSSAHPLFLNAVMLAEAANDAETMAEAWSEILAIAAVSNEQRELGSVGARHVEALIEQLGGHARLEATLASGRGQLELALGNYEASLAHHEHALEIGLERLGEDNPRVAQSRINLAGVQHKIGKVDEAIDNYQTAIASYEKAYGPQHPNLVGALAGLAGAYGDRGRYGESRPIYERALRIIEGSLRSKHPKAATVLNNLGGLEFAESNYDAALEYFERTRQIYAESHGPRSQAAAKTVINIGMVLERQEEYAEAIEMQLEAIEMLEAEFGAEHPDLASPLQNLGDEHLELDLLDEALPYYTRSLEIREKALGADHPRLGETLESIGRLQSKRGQYGAALAAYDRGVLIRTKGMGENHPATASILLNRARTHQAMNDRDLALADLERATAAVQGSNFPRLEIRARLDFATALRQAGKHEPAKAQVAQAKAIADGLGEGGHDLRERIANWP